MHKALASVAVVTVFLGAAVAADPPSTMPADVDRGITTMPSGGGCRAELKDGQACVEPATAGHKEGGLTVVESEWAFEQPEEIEAVAPAPPARDCRRPYAHERPRANPYQAPAARGRALPIGPDLRFDVPQRNPDGDLPLTGDLLFWICEYGPGHPTLCPSKYLGEIIRETRERHERRK